MNNIKKLLCILGVLLPTMMYAQGIKFEEGLTWEQVLEKAKKENKFIFVDCYATWCAPCKYMDKEIYPNDTVGRFFNSAFISVKVQMDTTKADDDFIKSWYVDASMMKRKHKVTAFPTYLFFSPEGDILHRGTGAKLQEKLIFMGAEALNSNKQYYTALEKYRRNELGTEYMKSLAYKVRDIEGDQLAGKIANDYLKQLSSNELFTKDNLQFMYEFTNSSKDIGFPILKDSAKKVSEINSVITEAWCHGKVLNIIYNEEIKPYRFIKHGKPDWKKVKANLRRYGSLGQEALSNNKPAIIFKSEIEPALKVNSDWKNNILPLIKKQNLGKNEEFVVGSTVVFYINAVGFYHTEKNCKNLVAAATYYADSFSTFLSDLALNTWAWTIFENSNNKNELGKALEWSKKSLELEGTSPQPESLDTYANLLYKLRRIPEAIEWENRAIIIDNRTATENNRKSDPIYKQTLEKMQKGIPTWPEK